MLGFKSFLSSQRTLAGIELVHMTAPGFGILDIQSVLG